CLLLALLRSRLWLWPRFRLPLARPKAFLRTLHQARDIVVALLPAFIVRRARSLHLRAQQVDDRTRTHPRPDHLGREIAQAVMYPASGVDVVEQVLPVFGATTAGVISAIAARPASRFAWPHSRRVPEISRQKRKQLIDKATRLLFAGERQILA